MNGRASTGGSASLHGVGGDPSPAGADARLRRLGPVIRQLAEELAAERQRNAALCGEVASLRARVGRAGSDDGTS